MTGRAPDFDVYQPAAVWIYPAKLECILGRSLSAGIWLKRVFPGFGELGQMHADCVLVEWPTRPVSCWCPSGVAPGPLTEVGLD